MYQFFHIDNYGIERQRPKTTGRAGGKMRTPRWTIDDIVAELVRKEGSCDHVEKPLPPVLIFGENPEDIAAEIKKNAADAVDPRGHKLRKDAQLLISGVTSWPVRRVDIDNEGRLEYLAWEQEVLKNLESRWGSNLRYVIRHEDEEFLHVHFGVSAERGADGTYSIDNLHPGNAARARAREEAKAKGLEPKRAKLEKAYCDAMRQVQDEFFRDVSVKFGQTRDGPKRKRLTRGEWKAQKHQAQMTANIVAERDAMQHRLAEIRAQEMDIARYKEALRIANELSEMVEREREKRERIEHRDEIQRRQLAAEKERADRAEAEVSRLSQIISRMKVWLKQAQGIIGRLIGKPEKLPSGCPQWLPEDVWTGVEQTVKERWVESQVEDYMAGVEIRQSTGFRAKPPPEKPAVRPRKP